MAISSQARIRVKVDAASSGDNTLVAAVSGYKIRVLAYHLVAAGAVTAKFQSAAAGTDLTGAMTMATGVPLTVPLEREGVIPDTVAGELLNLRLGGAVQVSGHITYCLVQ